MKKRIAVMMIAMAMSMSVMACGTGDAKDSTLTIQTVTAESIGAGAETSAETATETAQESETATEAVQATETLGNTDSVAGEAAATAENGITAGEYTSSYDGSTMTITDNNDGTYKVDLSLFRVTTLENGVGTMDGDKMTVEVVDPAEGNMGLEITAESDGTLTVTVTDSTWDILSNGTKFLEFKK